MVIAGATRTQRGGGSTTPVARRLAALNLDRLLGNATSTQAMMLRLAQLQDEGVMQNEDASLAKVLCAVKCRETIVYAREPLVGNRVLLENHR